MTSPLSRSGHTDRSRILRRSREIGWRRHPDSNRGITVLQTVALPLGYGASSPVAGEDLRFQSCRGRTATVTDPAGAGSKGACRRPDAAAGPPPVAPPRRSRRGGATAKKVERETGFEPATVTLARWGSTGLSYSRSSSISPVALPFPAVRPALRCQAKLILGMAEDSCQRRILRSQGPHHDLPQVAAPLGPRVPCGQGLRRQHRPWTRRARAGCPSFRAARRPPFAYSALTPMSAEGDPTNGLRGRGSGLREEDSACPFMS